MPGSLPIRRVLEQTLNVPIDRAEIIARKIVDIVSKTTSTDRAVEDAMGTSAFSSLEEDKKKQLLYRIDFHLLLSEMNTEK